MPRRQPQAESDDSTFERLLPAEIPLAELETELRIDRNDLESALEMQPDSFFRVAVQATLTSSRRDAAKQRLAELEADKDATLRHDARVADDKVTEKEIESEKRRDPGIKEMQRELLRLNAKLGLISALKDAFIQRSYVLKDLCLLQINGLYSELGDQHGIQGRRTMNQYKEERAQVAKQRMAELREERANNEHARTAGRSGVDRAGERRPRLHLARQ